MKCELIKRLSNEKYKGADGKEYNYKNYFLRFENGKECPITVGVFGDSDKAKAYKSTMFNLLDNMSVLEDIKK